MSRKDKLYVDPQMINKRVKIQAFPKRGDFVDIDKMEYHMGTLEAVSVYPVEVQVKLVGVPHFLRFDRKTCRVEFYQY